MKGTAGSRVRTERLLYCKVGTGPGEYVRLVSRGRVAVGSRVTFRRDTGHRTRTGRVVWSQREQGIVREIARVHNQDLHLLERW